HAGRRGLRRSGRHRPVHAGGPARLAHRGGDVCPPPRGVSVDGMTDPTGGTPQDVARGELVTMPAAEEPEERREAVEEPATVMRIGSMIKQLLEEVRTGSLDEPARARLKD